MPASSAQEMFGEDFRPKTGTYILIEVSDTGIGMNPEVQKRMFDPMFTTKKMGKGTGLGLAISRNIVEKHGGTIEVESRPEKGTSVTVVLPVKDTN